jgi:Protein of unknown function (DUF3592)
MIWIYILLISTGFLPLVVVLYKMSKVKRMKRNGIKTNGIVQIVYGISQRYLNSIVIEYTIAATNQVISKKIVVGGIPYRVGESLPLYYDRDKPEKMLLDSGKSFTTLLVFTLLLAAGIIAACFFIQSSVNSGQM